MIAPSHLERLRIELQKIVGERLAKRGACTWLGTDPMIVTNEIAFDWKCCSCGDERLDVLRVSRQVADATIPPTHAEQLVVRIFDEAAERELGRGVVRDMIALSIAEAVVRAGGCRCMKH